MARKCDTKEKIRKNAEIAQLVEHNLAKVGVASSSLVFRSLVKTAFSCLFFVIYHMDFYHEAIYNLSYDCFG